VGRARHHSQFRSVDSVVMGVLPGRVSGCPERVGVGVLRDRMVARGAMSGIDIGCVQLVDVVPVMVGKHPPLVPALAVCWPGK
jgi:hypothetical protein